MPGHAYAVNYAVKLMDVENRDDDRSAGFKRDERLELHYRPRALGRAEEETLKALELARNPIELSIARKQLLEVRRLRRESARDVAWTKPLTVPVLALSAMVVLTFVVMLWR